MTLPPCEEPVEDYIHPQCSHLIQAPKCHVKRKYQISPPLCVQIVSRPRFRCGHLVHVPCHKSLNVTNPRPGQRLSTSAAGFVDASLRYCEAEKDVDPCNAYVNFLPRCGHKVQGVRCFQAFEWASDVSPSARCQVLVPQKSPLCFHTLALSCGDAAAVRSWKPWGFRLLPRWEVKSVRFDDTSPAPLPNLPAEHFVCDSTVMLTRRCGHQERISCVFAFYENTLSPCRCTVIQKCPSCLVEKSLLCCDVRSSKEISCENKVTKVCSYCKVNNVETECSRQLVSCAKEVRVTRSCGHVLTWLCGVDKDPRSLEDYKCRECIILCWEEYVEWEKLGATNLDPISLYFNQIVRTSVADFIREDYEVLEVRSLDRGNHISTHFNYRLQLFSRYLDHLRWHCSANTPMVNPPKHLASLDEMNLNYRLVYKEEGDEHVGAATSMEKAFATTHNPSIGTGIELQILRYKELGSVHPSPDGMITLYIGFAFGLHCLETKSPPLPEHISNAEAFPYDTILLPQDALFVIDQAALLATHRVTLRYRKKCIRCGIYCKSSEGLECGFKHFACMTCLYNVLDNAHSGGNIPNEIVDCDGNLKCLECTLTFAFIEITNLPCSDLLLPLIRDLMRRKLEANQQLKQQPWTKAPAKVRSNCKVYYIRSMNHMAHKANRETSEFNMACAQFCRLLNQLPSVVTAVDVIEYDQNSSVSQNFDKKKASLVNKEEIWVFHGTTEDAMKKILEEGFKVGGVDDIGIANGRVYGNGVYTATGPKTPMCYTQGNKKVLLAKALSGDRGIDDRSGDSWVPKSDWMVFRSGAQLLPCYVVHYNL